MDDKGANIDLLFRNGLKDMEVLPPSEVWHNVSPAIRQRRQPVVLIRAAAIIVVLITTSLLAYRWSRQIPDTSVGNMIADSRVDINTDNTFSQTEIPSVTEVRYNTPVSPEVTDISTEESGDIIDEDRFTTDSPVMAYLMDSRDITVEKDDYQPDQLIPSFKLSSNERVDLDGLITQEPVDNNMGNSDRWAVTAMASPTYYSTINSGGNEFMQSLRESEQPVISYSGGVAFSYKINRRVTVQSGLYYSSVGQEVGGIKTYGGYQDYNFTKGTPSFGVLTTSGTVYTSNPDVYLLSENTPDKLFNYNRNTLDPAKADLQYLNSILLQHFSYIELPLILRYKVIDRVVDLNLIGGLSYNMLVRNSVFTIIDGGRYPVGETDGLNTFALSSSLGMGMEYSLTDNLSFNLEPTFRYYLNSFNDISLSGIHPYSFGLFSGISYKF